ncbi:hypothetical protein PHYC_03401 [Phycisphaerales bacterium]|nr:hypothetical protein PHYC_03401 [Phycisphaerales bacterium]
MRIPAISAVVVAACAAMGQVAIVDDAGSARNGKVGAFSSIVADGGQVAISYYCEEDWNGSPPTAYDLRFAWNTGGAWQWTTVDGLDGSWVGSDTCMGRAADGTYHIVYQGAFGLSWAHGGATTWTIEPDRVDSASGPLDVSMVLDSQGRPHVAYFDFSGSAPLKYTYWNGAAWMRGSEEIVQSNAWYPWMESNNRFLALDINGEPHVVFGDSNFDLWYYTLANGVWSREQISNNGYDPSLVIGADNIPRVAFRQGDRIVYGVRSGGGWTFEDVAAGQTGISNIRGICIAVSDAGVPFVCFGMSVNEDMYLARREAGGWTMSMIDGDGSPSASLILGRYGTSLDIDASGAPHVSYQAIDIYSTTHRADLRTYGGGGSGGCAQFVSHPASASVCVPDLANFSVGVSGSGPFSYLWQVGDASAPGGWRDLSDGPLVIDGFDLGFITGSASQTMTRDGSVGGWTHPISTRDFRCVVTDSCGPITSNPATLTVTDCACGQFASQPAGASACTTEIATFSVGMTGPGPFSYVWQVWDDAAFPDYWRDLTDGPLVIDGYDLGLISGSSTATLTRDGSVGGWTHPQATRDFRCVVTDSCGPMTSHPATLTITQCAEPCDPDVNCDGAINGFDIEVMEQTVNGDDDNFCQADEDFNKDGALNGFDIEAVEQVVNGAPCP